MGLDLFLWGFVHLELEQIPSVSVITTPHDIHCPGSVSGACGTVAGTVGNSAGTDGGWFWFVLGRSKITSWDIPLIAARFSRSLSKKKKKCSCDSTQETLMDKIESIRQL